MFCCPFENYYREAPVYSYVRLLHTSPKTPPVDVYLDGKKIINNLAYNKFTEYQKLKTGTHNVKLYVRGDTRKPILNKNLNVPSGKILTIAAINTYPNVNLQAINEPVGPIMRNKSLIKLVHLSPNSPSVDLALKNGTSLFKNVSYTQGTDYIPLNPSDYNFEVKASGSNKVVLYVPNIRLIGNRFYSFYVTGLLGERPPLTALIPLDGNSYLKF